MKIGIDARLLGLYNRGPGRYILQLVEHVDKLAASRSDALRLAEFEVFLTTENWTEYEPANPRFRKSLANYHWYSLAEQILWPARLYRSKLDLVHFPFFNVPLLYLKPYIVTVHDLQMFHYPSSRATTHFKPVYWFKHLAMRVVTWWAMKFSKLVIVPSQYVKDDLMRTFRVKPSKITVTYEGTPEVKKINNQENNKSILEKYKIRKPFLFYVGSAYPHKNLERLMKAFKILKTKHGWQGQLVLGGRKDFFYERLERSVTSSLKNSIVFAGFIPEHDLTALYYQAELYVLPSLDEGFGLPALEAQAHNCAVVAARAGPLPEILEDSAIYFDPRQVDDIAKAMHQTLVDKDLRQGLVSQGRKNVKRFSWQTMAEQSLDQYAQFIS